MSEQKRKLNVPGSAKKGSGRSDEFVKVVEERLSQWAKQKPNEVVIGTASSEEPPLTRKKIHEHVVKKTGLGQQLLKGYMDAAINTVFKAKIK